MLGKFGVIMADPPWEIHQTLPYGTLSDNEMREMRWGELQDDGVIFLWVTGRRRDVLECVYPSHGLAVAHLIFAVSCFMLHDVFVTYSVFFHDISYLLFVSNAPQWLK